MEIADYLIGIVNLSTWSVQTQSRSRSRSQFVPSFLKGNPKDPPDLDFGHLGHVSLPYSHQCVYCQDVCCCCLQFKKVQIQGNSS